MNIEMLFVFHFLGGYPVSLKCQVLNVSVNGMFTRHLLKSNQIFTNPLKSNCSDESEIYWESEIMGVLENIPKNYYHENDLGWVINTKFSFLTLAEGEILQI